MRNDKDTKRECPPCCHNGHGVKKKPVKGVEEGRTIYLCWLESCKKKVSWFDDVGLVWRYDSCEHIKRDKHGDMVF